VADENVKEYTNYKGEKIEVSWCVTETEKGCLKPLFVLLLPVIAVLVEAVHG